MSAIGKMSDLLDRIRRRAGNIEHEKLVPDPDTLKDLASEAIREFERLRPRVVTFESASNGSDRRFVLDALISGWKNGTCVVDSVLSVSGANNHNELATPLTLDEWRLEVDATGKDVLYLADPVPSGGHLRIKYRQPHVVDESDAALTTVREGDAELLVLFGVKALCHWIALSASDLKDSTLGSDQVDFGEIAARFSDRAKEAEKKITSLTRTDEASVAPGGGAIEWDTRSQLTERPRIGH